MGNKRLINILLTFLLLIIMVGCCSGQPIVIIPKSTVPTTAHQFLVWDGTTFKLKELVGFTVTSTQMTIPSATDGSITNEGLLGVGAGTSTSSILTTNTSTGTGVTINANAPLSITELTSSNGGSITLSVAETSLTNHGSININNTSLTTVTNGGISEDNGSNSAFTIYLHYTTNATTEGMRFRLEPTGTGTFWYDYDFPITGSRVRGIIYNANTTIVVPSSETGTNVGIIRGISKSGGGAFSIALQVSAEDGSSSITTLTTGVTQY